MNTKLALVALALVASTAAQAAAPAWRPSGRLLLLPARQQNPSPPAAEPNNTQTGDSEPSRLLDSGEYYVLLEDGRLQMVKYTAAALKEDKPTVPQQPQQPLPFPYVQLQQQQQVAPAPAKLQAEPFAQFQVEYLQYPQVQVTDDSQKAAQKEQPETEEVSGFEAKVQYRDVKPITAPVFAYNPAPLVRILKK